MRTNWFTTQKRRLGTSTKPRLMTRVSNTNNSSSSSNMSAMEALLQTHNDLIFAIHKSVTESFATVNSNISTLTDEIKELKRQISNKFSQKTNKDEVTSWQMYSEKLLLQQNEQHQKEIDRLVGILKNQSLSSDSSTQLHHSVANVQQNSLDEYQRMIQFFNSFSQTAPNVVNPQNNANNNMYQHLMQQMLPATTTTFPVSNSSSSTTFPANSATTTNMTQQNQNKPLFGDMSKPVVVPQQQQLPKNVVPPQQKQSVVPAVAQQQQQQKSVVVVKNLDEFKPKAGSWNCSTCMVNNAANVTICPCCSTPKDSTTASAGIKPALANTNNSSGNAVLFKFNPPKSSGGETPKVEVGSTKVVEPSKGFETTKSNTTTITTTSSSSSATSVFGSAPLFGNSALKSPFASSLAQNSTSGAAAAGAGANKTSSLFGIASSTQENNNKTITNNNSSSSPFSTQKSGSLFGGGPTKTFASVAANNNTGFLGQSTTTTTTPNASPFGNVKDNQLFQTKKTPVTEGKSEGKDETSDNEAESFVPDAHFEPVVQLPLVETATGEEDEEIVFVNRCKLYRYESESKTNKERGVGDIKILRNKTTNRYRCVMRREQVLKLCANFPIFASLKLTQKVNVPAAYTWGCKDYSEDTVNGVDEVFCARFKDASIAKEFSDKMNSVIENIGQ